MEDNSIGKMEDVKDEVIAISAEVYSRVVGYYRPVNNWNDGKREEFEDRKYLSCGCEEVAE